MERQQEPRTIKTGTINFYRGEFLRTGDGFKSLANQDLDIVLMQEIDDRDKDYDEQVQQFENQLDDAGYMVAHRFSELAIGVKKGSKLLDVYHQPLQSMGRLASWGSKLSRKTPERWERKWHRDAIGATVELEDGTIITAISAHITTPDRMVERPKQERRLGNFTRQVTQSATERFGAHPVIVGGDFNTFFRPNAASQRISRYTNMRPIDFGGEATYDHNYQREKQHKYMGWWPIRKTIGPVILDHVFHNEMLEPVESRVIVTGKTDHCELYSELAVVVS